MFASRDEEGDELLFGVFKAFGDACLLLARLAGSNMPFSLETSRIPCTSTMFVSVEGLLAIGESVEVFEAFWNVQIASLNVSQCTSRPSCRQLASNL
jgi:hypothetical protein